MDIEIRKMHEERIGKIRFRLKEIVREQEQISDGAGGKRSLTPQENNQWRRLDEEFSNCQDELRKLNESGHPSTGGGEYDNDGHFIAATNEDRRLAMSKSEYRFDLNGKTERDSFNRYLRDGAHALAAEEFRALQANNDTAGGYLVVPQQLANEVIVGLNELVHIRQRARVFSVPKAESFGVPALDDDFGDPEWVGELSSGSEDTAMDFDKRELHPHPIARRLKVSNKLLRSSLTNPESLVMERMIYKIGVVQEKAFISGSGANQPLGVMTVSAQGINTDRDISTGNLQTSVTGDGLMNAINHLKPQYRRGAVWLMHRDLELQIRKLKTADGDYIWRAGLAEGSPNMLLGLPVLLSEYMGNTFSSGQYVAAIANLNYYWVVDAMDMQVQRLVELYAEQNQTGFICRAECDAMPVLSAAFVRVKLA